MLLCQHSVLFVKISTLLIVFISFIYELSGYWLTLLRSPVYIWDYIALFTKISHDDSIFLSWNKLEFSHRPLLEQHLKADAFLPLRWTSPLLETGALLNIYKALIAIRHEIRISLTRLQQLQLLLNSYNSCPLKILKIKSWSVEVSDSLCWTT